MNAVRWQGKFGYVTTHVNVVISGLDNAVRQPEVLKLIGVWLSEVRLVLFDSWAGKEREKKN